MSSSPGKIKMTNVNHSNIVISARMNTTDTLKSRMKLEKREKKQDPANASKSGLWNCGLFCCVLILWRLPCTTKQSFRYIISLYLF